MIIELKPCPFCGADARLYVGEQGVAVRCSRKYGECGCRTEYKQDYSAVTGMDKWYKGETAIESVVEVWNRRANNDVG